MLPHDSNLGDYSHLCPRVIMGGHVKIGMRCMVGLGAMIRDHVTIGDNCTIGMGSVVLHDVPDNTRGWGNPFRAQ
jgi:acetyltransferase-like isoleucine patch superfamily enzyme